MLTRIQAVRLDPSNASALFNRGSALDSLGHFDDAIADFTRALELDMAGGGGGSGGGGGRVRGRESPA